MVDTLYGADLGAVATDIAGNVKDTNSFQVYTDPQGANLFTLTKGCTSTFGIGNATGGTVTSTTIGRILFYATDTTATLWLKNGTNLWAVNPVSPLANLQTQFANLQTSVNGALADTSSRITDTETNITTLQNNPIPPWQEWRGRIAANRTCVSSNYVSLNFAAPVTSPSAFTVNLVDHALSVSVNGWYRLSMRASFGTNPTGNRSSYILLNSGLTILDQSATPVGVSAQDNRAPVTDTGTSMGIAEDFYLNTTDSILFVVRQTSGVSLDVNSGRQLTSASIARLGTA